MITSFIAYFMTQGQASVQSECTPSAVQYVVPITNTDHFTQLVMYLNPYTNYTLDLRAINAAGPGHYFMETVQTLETGNRSGLIMNCKQTKHIFRHQHIILVTTYT